MLPDGWLALYSVYIYIYVYIVVELTRYSVVSGPLLLHPLLGPSETTHICVHVLTV